MARVGRDFVKIVDIATRVVHRIQHEFGRSNVPDLVDGIGVFIVVRGVAAATVLVESRARVARFRPGGDRCLESNQTSREWNCDGCYCCCGCY